MKTKLEKKRGNSFFNDIKTQKKVMSFRVTGKKRFPRTQLAFNFKPNFKGLDEAYEQLKELRTGTVWAILKGGSKRLLHRKIQYV